MGPPLMETVVHPSAVVLPGVELGTGVEVGPFSVLEPGVVVGDGCRIGPHVHLLGRTELGPGCVLRSGVVLGGEPQDDKYQGERTLVRIGADCQFHEHATVHRATGEEGETVLGDGVRMMAGSHIGHNCRVGDRVVMVNGAALGGHGEVGSHAHTHRSMGLMPIDEATAEMAESRRALGEELGGTISSFAYPFGTQSDFNAATDRALTESGYEVAFSSIHGAVRQGMAPVSLPRIKVEGGESLAMFERLSRGGLDAWQLVDRSLWRLQRVRAEVS